MSPRRRGEQPEGRPEPVAEPMEAGVAPAAEAQPVAAALALLLAELEQRLERLGGAQRAVARGAAELSTALAQLADQAAAPPDPSPERTTAGEAPREQEVPAALGVSPAGGPQLAGRGPESVQAEPRERAVPVPQEHALHHGGPPAYPGPAQRRPSISEIHAQVQVTVEAPPAGEEQWRRLFRSPAFTAALEQFLEEWAYREVQRSDPGPAY
jgi:hypothetical protein